VISERSYRQRLDADLANWQADGLLPPSAVAAIRSRQPPIPQGITIATVVAIVGGLLIAAAFLAFIAANWTAIARPARFGILLVGIAGAYTLGALFDRAERPHLSDLAATVGTIIFGSAIALVGQMYHLSEDFAAGLLLWAGGALFAAVLTNSRGALAVALVAACLWSGTRVNDTSDIHLPFVGFWLITAVLAVAWDTRAARHLVAIAAVAWWVLFAVGVDGVPHASPILAFGGGAGVMLGAGLLLASRGSDSSRAFGFVLAEYGSLALAVAVAVAVLGPPGMDRAIPPLLGGIAAAGLILVCIAAGLTRRAGTMLAGVTIALALLVLSGLLKQSGVDNPWAVYAVALLSMLALVMSGTLDDIRPRVVAGWLGLAAIIAAITWVVKGSLLDRAVFLAIAGLVAVGLASALGRLTRREPTR
jgi:uncharacterized membrane protein